MKRFPCKISLYMLIFGCFAVICQTAFIILHASFFHPTASASVILHTYFPYMQYPIASLALLLAGSWLIDLTVMKNE